MLLNADTSDAAKLTEQFSQLQKIFRRQETGGKPIVAAINGTALGGGFEICLACHHRIAAANPKAKVGQPEVKIGLLPGGGGTQRIPRLIGVMNAAPILLEGKDLTVDAAKGLGLIHEVVPAGELLAKAKAWLTAAPTEQVVPEYAGKGAKAIDGRAVQPWDRKGFKTPGFPGGQVWSPVGVQTFIGGNAMIAGKTNGVYPAPKAIMSCVYEGLQLPFDSGLKVETRYFVSLLRNPVAKSMIRTLFFGLQEANKLARRPKGVPKQEYKKIGVLGAGLMGAGIATVSVQAGIDIVLIDRDQAAADKGKAHIAGELDKLVKRGRLDQARRDALLAKVTATPDFGALKDCDLVVEAVFENREVKAEATKKAEASLPKGAVFASNTSTLPITGLAEASARPDHFIGLHFFSPVEKMPLVEIIVGKKTSPETLARSMDFVQKIRKTPIVVNDSRGFFTSRVCGAFISEGHRMLKEGIPAAMIENCARYAGMPVGPLSLNDEVAIDLSWKIMDQTRRDAEATRPQVRIVGHRGRPRADGQEARALRPQERQGLLRLSGRRQEAAVAGAAEALPGRSQAALRRGRGEARQGGRDQEAPALRAVRRHGALPGRQRADRAAGRRCRFDHGSWLRAADRRGDQPDRPGRREAVRRRVR